MAKKLSVKEQAKVRIPLTRNSPPKKGGKKK